MRRGDVWLAEVESKLRPVLVLTRGEVIDVRANVTVAEITTRARGLTVEVAVDTNAGIQKPSVINGDGLHTISRRRLTKQFGSVNNETLEEICRAVGTALGCEIG